MNDILEWFRAHPAAWWWLVASAILMFVGGLILVPFVVTRIPDDYFVHRKRRRLRWGRYHLVIQLLLLTAKNTLGILVISLGIVMLFIPGQGLLSILAGIMLLDFPGKFGLERWLVSRPPVLRAVNWLRRRSHRNPLIVDD